MKVVYEQSIVKQLNEAIFAARLNRQDIKKFVLTPVEYERLRYECSYAFPPAIPPKFRGIPVEVEDE